MTDEDLLIAITLERIILGNQIRIDCNCVLAVLCTMPYTYWVRVWKYWHRCPRHGKGSDHLLRNDPCWITPDGLYIPRVSFEEKFNTLVAMGAEALPGAVFDQGRQRHLSMVSVEGTHYITATGNTQKLAEAMGRPGPPWTI